MNNYEKIDNMFEQPKNMSIEMIIDRLKYYLHKSWFYPIGIVFHPETLAIIIDKFNKKQNVSFRDRIIGISIYASKNISKGTFKIAKTSEELYKILNIKN